MAPHCRRGATKRSRFCGTCWSFVPTETKLALEGHHDAASRSWHWIQPEDGAIRREDRERWVDFVRWSYEETLNLAAYQSYEARAQRALDVAGALASAFTEETDDEREPPPD